MNERREFQMSDSDLTELKKAISDARNTPLIMLQCGRRPTLQEAANDAWERLGRKMGFKHMTVRPNGRGEKFFTAEPMEPGHG